MNPKKGLQDRHIKSAKNLILTLALWKVKSIQSFIKREIVVNKIKSLVVTKPVIISFLVMHL